MDDILFINDFTLLNSQSNAGSRSSRPQAWSKNVVSIGGIRHFNTASATDDRWQSGASIGPAADGRIKPDLAHFYDSVCTTTSTSNTAYTSSFAARAPQLRSPRDISASSSRCCMSGCLQMRPEARPFLIAAAHVEPQSCDDQHCAVQWDMTIPGSDVTPSRQGLGPPRSLKNLYDRKSTIFIINENSVDESAVYVYQLPVAADRNGSR